MLRPQSDLSWLDTKSLLQLHAASLSQMQDSIRLMIEIEEELAVQPHQSRVGSTLSQHRQRILEEVRYYLERMGIEEEIQTVVRRRSRQLQSEQYSASPYMNRLLSDSGLLDTDLKCSPELDQSPSDQVRA